MKEQIDHLYRYSLEGKDLVQQTKFINERGQVCENCDYSHWICDDVCNCEKLKIGITKPYTYRCRFWYNQYYRGKSKRESD